MSRWWDVVSLYSLRLCFAPVVETVMLLDRCLYLKESGVDNVSLLPIFDPTQSPRNCVIVATKKHCGGGGSDMASSAPSAGLA